MGNVGTINCANGVCVVSLKAVTTVYVLYVILTQDYVATFWSNIHLKIGFDIITFP
jgi:hypothetical protein